MAPTPSACRRARRQQTLRVDGALQVSGGLATDLITLDRAFIVGQAKLSTGGGADTIAIDDSLLFGPFSLNSGAGADIINLELDAAQLGVTSFVSTVNIQAGSGDDTLTAGVAADPDRQVVFGVDVILNGGSGSNTLSLANVSPLETDPIYTILNWV